MIQHVRTVFSFKNKKNDLFLIKKTQHENEAEERDVRAPWAKSGGLLEEPQTGCGPKENLPREETEEEEEGVAWAGGPPTETRVCERREKAQSSAPTNQRERHLYPMRH